MKNLMISTALLVATAGMAAAEVNLSGSGRFGLTYSEDRAGGTEEETQLTYRLRFNIDAKTETDSGVTFGGRIRMQNTDGQTGAALSAAYVYASYEGFRVEVGNANGAFDSTALFYNSELGFTGFGAGDPIGNFQSFSSGPYGAGSNERIGIFAAYSVGDLNVRASWHTQNQATLADTDDEFSISADYKFGSLTVSGAYASNVGFVNDTDLFGLGAEYGFNDAGNVGILYFNLDDGVLNEDKITLYANYGFDAVTVRGFVSFDEEAAGLTGEETAYGIGVDYDLGGATLAAGIQQGFDGNTYGEVGVNFSF